MSNVAVVLTLFLCFYNLQWSSSYYYDEERLPTFLSASVGEHVVFECDIEFPQDIPIPYILNWRKEVDIQQNLFFFPIFVLNNL